MNGTSLYTSHSLDHQQASICDNLQEPKFKLEQVQLQFQLNNKLRKLVVFKNIMYIISNSACYKIDLENPSQVEKYNLPHGSFINCWTNGDILVIRMDQQYFQLDQKFKPIPKFKGMNIIQILFNHVWLIATTDTIYIQETKMKQVFKGKIQGIAMNKVQINVISNFQLHTWDYFDSTYSELINVFKTQPLVRTVKSSEDYLFTFDDQTFLFISEGFLTNDEQIQSINDEIESLSGLILSPHHIIGYRNGVSIFNKLNLARTNIPLNDIIGITSDYASNTYWIYTNNSIHELVIENESASIWYDYYKMGNYQDALKCLEDNEDNYPKRDLVLIKQGYDYLQKGGFGVASDADSVNEQLKGIRNLAKSSEPFEKVCLMLLQDTMIVSDKLLIEYLMLKFDNYKRERNKIKIIVLSSWIIELMDDPKDFIKSNYKLLDPPTMYEILKDPIYFAELIEDYKFIFNHFLDHKQYSQAVKILHKLDTEEVYSTANVLLLNYPKIVEIWLRMDLEYERFLPAILLYCKKNPPNVITQFLQKIHEKGYKSLILNNFYLTLLIESGLEKQFIKFINSEKLYDQNFILRLCIANEKYQSAILIYHEMGLYNQALDLALKNNLTNLAELVLMKYEEHIEEETDITLQQESYSTRKKLWLTFSKHLIDNVGNTDLQDNTLNGVLRYILSNSILGLKDLLPLFPDNIMVNDFKDEIVKTLNEYNNKINQLSTEMKDSMDISSKLKLQLKESRQEKARIYSIIEPGEPCKLCNKLLISKNFVIFPNCNHGFHKECLIVDLSKSNNYKFKKLYQDFKKNPEVNKNELNQIILKDCILCNSSHINTIDDTFELSGDWNL